MSKFKFQSSSLQSRNNVLVRSSRQTMWIPVTVVVVLLTDLTFTQADDSEVRLVGMVVFPLQMGN